MPSLDIFGKFNDEFKGLQNGFLDEVRFTQALRYTPGQNFTPPTKSALDGAIFDDDVVTPPPPPGGPGDRTTALFDRLDYNYSGSGVLEFGKNVINTMNTVPQLLPDWALEDLKTNNVGKYVVNPAVNVVNRIQTICLRGDVESPTVANTLWYAARDFKDHTDRLAGVVEINPETTANLPHFSTAVSTGKNITYLVQQSDGYSNSACILGNFTSILCVPELEQKVAGLGPKTTGLMNELIAYLNGRRTHDENFFTKSKKILQEYDELKKFSRMGATEKYIISNFLASDKLKDRGINPVDSGCNITDSSLSVDTVNTIDNICEGREPEEPPIVCTTAEVNQFYKATVALTTGDEPEEPTCTTKSVDHYRSFPPTTSREDFNNMRLNETASAEFFPTTASGIQKGVNIIIYTPSPGQDEFNGIESVISECKGDFDNIPPGNEEGGCRIFGATFSMRLSTTTLPKQSVPEIQHKRTCFLDSNKKYFLNMRFRNPDDPNIPSCTDPNGCGLYVSLGYNSG